MDPKRQGVQQKAASISKYMRNQPTPSDRVKPIHNNHETIFGYVTNDDDKGRTACDEANDLESIIAVLSSAEQDKQAFPRPLPPPEPPPPPPRWPWPETNNILALTNANGTAHEGIFPVKSSARGIQSSLWYGPTPTRIKQRRTNG